MNMVIIEKAIAASTAQVWRALTDPEEMKAWYFDLPWFRPEVGFEFRFIGGPSSDRQYEHVCMVTEAVPFKKLAYSWRYHGYPGITLVKFDLSEEADNTLIKLSHEGLNSLSAEVPDFAETNFIEGWNQIIGIALPHYVEEQHKPRSNANT